MACRGSSPPAPAICYNENQSSPPAGGELHKRIPRLNERVSRPDALQRAPGHRRRAPPTHPTGKVNDFQAPYRCYALPGNVFPARVGLSPPSLTRQKKNPRFPHACRVEPFEGMRHHGAQLFPTQLSSKSFDEMDKQIYTLTTALVLHGAPLRSYTHKEAPTIL